MNMYYAVNTLIIYGCLFTLLLMAMNAIYNCLNNIITNRPDVQNGSNCKLYGTINGLPITRKYKYESKN